MEEPGPKAPLRGAPTGVDVIDRAPITAICSVNFHLTEGQNVDACYPPGSLDAEELGLIAFHSFPDSMSFELQSHSSVRDSSFFFRVRRSRAAPPTAADAHAARFLYGHVFCRQRQDERLQRGGEQRSIVVLSPLPLGPTLDAVARYAGPLGLAHGPEALQRVFDEVSAWPLLEWGGTMDLPLGLGSIHVDLPELSMLPAHAVAAAAEALALHAAHDSSAAASAPAPVAAAELLAEELDEATGLPPGLLPGAYGQQAPACGMFGDVDCYIPLRGVLPRAWALWELILVGEPLLVASPTPCGCSAAVAALVSLLAPFPCATDFRPFFTIHDPAFGPMAAGALPGRTPAAAHLPSLLGVTNPFFLKSLVHWPNVISTGYTPDTQIEGGGSSLDEDGSGHGGGSSPAAAAAAAPKPSNGGRGAAARQGLSSLLRRRAAGAQSLLTHPADTAWLSYRPCVREDSEVLASLVHPLASDPPAKRRRLAQINAGILRRHFEELTRAVLFPLLPFISPAPPPAAGATPQELRSPPPLPPFDPAAVLASLSVKGAAVPEILSRRFPGRGALAQFYERLLASPSLAAWLAARRGAAEAWQAAAWRGAWRSAGGAWALPGVEHTDEVAAVEAYFTLEEQARAAAAATAAVDAGDEDGEGEEPQALRQLREAFGRLPADLRASLLLSPDRAGLLGGVEAAAAGAQSAAA